MVCEINLRLLRGMSLTAVILNVLTLAGLIIANAFDPSYFASSGPGSSIVVNNVNAQNFSIFSMAGLNFMIRYVLSPLYFITTVIMIAVAARSWAAPCKMTERKYQTLVRFCTLWQFATLIVHTFVISAAIDIMRVFVNAGAFRNILRPFIGVTFPWHLLVLLLIIPAIIAFVMILVLFFHYLRYYRCLAIRNRLTSGEQPQPIVVDIPDSPLCDKKTRVIKVEAEAPMDMDGKVRVLLKEKPDGAFEIITEEQFMELNIEDTDMSEHQNTAFSP